MTPSLTAARMARLLSKMTGLFAATAFGAPDSFAAGVVNVVAYGAGMALVVTALTVSLAVANHALLRVLRSVMRHANQLVQFILHAAAGVIQASTNTTGSCDVLILMHF